MSLQSLSRVRFGTVRRQVRGNSCIIVLRLEVGDDICNYQDFYIYKQKNFGPGFIHFVGRAGNLGLVLPTT